jgi:hypothetical protein
MLSAGGKESRLGKRMLKLEPERRLISVEQTLKGKKIKKIDYSRNKSIKKVSRIRT